MVLDDNRDGSPVTDFLTVRQASRRFRLSPGRLRAAIRAGELPAYKPGRRWVRVFEPDVIAYLRANRVQPTTTAQAEFVRRRVAEIMGKGVRL